MKAPIVPLRSEHADLLYPLIKDAAVTSTIQWDGPRSLDEYRAGLEERVKQVSAGSTHMFTIVDPESGAPAGSIDIRPDENRFRADIGLWIGVPFRGKGLGTGAVRAITTYGFDTLKLTKIEGKIFVGNLASRRIFEKCGYRLEGTIRSCVQKRGIPIDDWVMGILREELR
jgi:RimJ/RimL family protein N-acetyltransferase